MIGGAKTAMSQMRAVLRYAGYARQKKMNRPNNFQRFRELNYLQQATLAAAILERMLPNYMLFSDATEFGSAHELRSVLNSIWEKLALPKSKISLEKLVDKVENNTPELNDFDMFGVYPAIDVCTALITLLNGMMSKDSSEFLNVSKISQASVAKFIEYQLTCDDILADNKAIRNHPLMQYEIDVLAELIACSESQERITSESVKELKQLALSDKQTNIGIEID